MDTPRYDQAAGLRRLFSTRPGCAVAFVAGREANGRTRLLMRTAIALADGGENVLVIDENRGDDNMHSAFGVKPGPDLLDLVERELSPAQLVQPVAPRLSVAFAARLALRESLTEDHSHRLDAALRTLQTSYSYVLIDSVDRPDRPMSVLSAAAPSLAVVVAAHSGAITGGYALIKRLARESRRKSFHVVITRARSDEESRAVFRNLADTAQRHLGVKLEFLAGASRPAAEHIAVPLEARLRGETAPFRSLAPNFA